MNVRPAAWGKATGRFGSGRTGNQTTKPDNSAWATVGSSRIAETIVAASIVKIFIVTLLQTATPA